MNAMLPGSSLAIDCVCGLTRTTLRADIEDLVNKVSASIVSIAVNDSLAPSSVTTNLGLPERWLSFVLETPHDIYTAHCS